MRTNYYAVVYFSPEELNPRVVYTSQVIDGAASYMMTVCYPLEDEDVDKAYLKIIDLSISEYSQEYDHDMASEAALFCYADDDFDTDLEAGYYYVRDEESVICEQEYDKELLDEALGL